MKSLLVDALRQLEDGDDDGRRPEPEVPTEQGAKPLELEEDAARLASTDVEDAIQVEPAGSVGTTGMDSSSELELQPDVSATTVSVEGTNPLARTLVSTTAANEGAGVAANRRRVPSLLGEAAAERSGFSADTPYLQRAARYTPLLCLLVGFCSTAIYLTYAHALDAKTTFGVLPGSSEMRTKPEADGFGSAFVMSSDPAASSAAPGPQSALAADATDDEPAGVGAADRPPEETPAERTASAPADPGFAIANSAYDAWRRGNAAKAEDLYREALRMSPNQPDALLGLAAVLSRQGRAAEAKNLYATLLSVDPGHPAAVDALLSTLAAGAVGAEELVALSERYPRSPELSFALGRRLAAMGHWAEARLLFGSAFDQAPLRADYAFNTAVAHDRVGRYRQAAGLYARALELDARGSAPYRDEASRRLAELSAMTGQTP